MNEYVARARRLITRSLLLLLVVGLTLTAVPASATPRDGTFEGTTSQGRTIRFAVENATIDSITITVVHADCNLTVRARVRGLNVRVRSDDTFTVRLARVGDPDDTIVVKGQFETRRRASGEFRSVQGGQGCNDAVTGTWDARLT
jgi:hypothetical protein